MRTREGARGDGARLAGQPVGAPAAAGQARPRQQFRALATAAMLTVAILSGPAGLAHADDKASCQGRGGAWNPTFGYCMDHTCEHDGQTYQGGDFIAVTATQYGWGTSGSRSTTAFYMCDGRTGQWILIRTAPTGPPVAPIDNPGVAAR